MQTTCKIQTIWTLTLPYVPLLQKNFQQSLSFKKVFLSIKPFFALKGSFAIPAMFLNGGFPYPQLFLLNRLCLAWYFPAHGPFHSLHTYRSTYYGMEDLTITPFPPPPQQSIRGQRDLKSPLPQAALALPARNSYWGHHLRPPTHPRSRVKVNINAKGVRIFSGNILITSVLRTDCLTLTQCVNLNFRRARISQGITLLNLKPNNKKTLPWWRWLFNNFPAISLAL